VAQYYWEYARRNLHSSGRPLPHVRLGPAICFGEWGGWGGEGPDRVWQDALASWMTENDVTDSFYWCLNPNSGDTGEASHQPQYAALGSSPQPRA
jgi:aryl-phospho-beta-D-glucosidase BglC (GH1 family)